MRPPPLRIRKEKHKSGEGGFAPGDGRRGKAWGLFQRGRERRSLLIHSCKQAPSSSFPISQAGEANEDGRGEKDFLCGGCMGKISLSRDDGGEEEGGW